MRNPDGHPAGEVVPSGGAPARGPGGTTQHSIDQHDEHHAPHQGWRRAWRIGRLGLVGSAIIVVSANLIRCLAVAPATAHVTPDATSHAPPAGGASGPDARSSEQVAVETPDLPRAHR